MPNLIFILVFSGDSLSSPVFARSPLKKFGFMAVRKRRSTVGEGELGKKRTSSPLASTRITPLAKRIKTVHIRNDDFDELKEVCFFTIFIFVLLFPVTRSAL